MVEPIRLLDLHGLPKVRDSWSFLYLEMVSIDRRDHALVASNNSGSWEIPTGMLLALLLGPGTSITHGAMQVLVESSSTVLWIGQEGVRFYAMGRASTHGYTNALRQIQAYGDRDDRRQVVHRMYAMRFGEITDPSDSIDVLRGREGLRMREAYAQYAKEYGVTWSGRSYGDSDSINFALSWANACLYGVTTAALHAMGWLVGLGFIHTGKALSFVYDIADLYKVEVVFPVAFEIASTSEHSSESKIRMAMRSAISEAKLLERIPKDVMKLFGDIGKFQDVDWANYTSFETPPLLDI